MKNNNTVPINSPNKQQYHHSPVIINEVKFSNLFIKVTKRERKVVIIK